MKIRWLAVLGMCAIGALTLTGCDSKIGAAAEVNGTKISESDVTRYLDPAAADAGRARNLALDYQIRAQLFTVALEKKHAMPSDAELAKLHDVAVSNLLGQQVRGSQADQALRGVMAQNGLKPSFADELTRSFELELSYAKVINAGQEAAVVSDLAKQKIPVSVSPRFGSWDTSTFSFTGLSTKQLPSVVSIDGALPGDAKATPGQ